MEEDHEDYNYSSPPSTSMVDYGNTQAGWFQPHHQAHHSVQIQMDPESAQPQHAHFNHLPPKFPAKAGSNVSRNHSELIEGLKAESDQSSRPASRAGLRFIPEFLQDSRIVNLLFGSQSNSSQNANLPHHHYQNYSNLTKYHHQHRTQHANNPNTFLLKTPTKKQRHPQAPNTPLLNESSANDLSRTTRTNQPNQSLLVSNTPFSMNASNASIGGNLNLNNFNTSLSATTMNNSQHLAGSHQNLVGSSAAGSAAGSNISGRSKPTKRNIVEHDDLSASDYDQRFEATTGRNHRNLRLNRTSTLNQTPTAKYSNLPTAPVLPTFNSSTSSAAKSRMSPFMNRLRNSLNFSSHHYRNLNKLSARNKRNSFSSAISLKSKCDNPTSDQLVTPNGFHFPQAYVPPKNPNQYLPLHLRSQESASALTLDQENELNNNLNNAANLNKTTTDSNDTIEIKISPASRASHRNLNSTEPQSLANLEEEENLIVMDDLSSKSEEKDAKPEEVAHEKEGEYEKESTEESKMRSQNSSYTIATAAEILKASNENELAKLKSSTKPSINNQDSQPLTSGTLTGGTMTENHSKSSSTRSSSTELNQDHEVSNENQSLIENKNECEASTTEAASAALAEPQPEEEEEEEEEDEAEDAEKPYEDTHEERYEESPTSSTDSLSPYESNQNTVSSYTQLLEKDKNNGEY